jgi:hypothetical protein
LRLAIRQLLNALARKPQRLVRRLLRLLDESMHDDNAPRDDEAVERPADARAAPRPQLEQSLAKRAGVRKPQVWTVLGEQFNEARVIGHNIYRLRLDLSKHPLVEVLDLERHGAKVSTYANMAQLVRVTPTV